MASYPPASNMNTYYTCVGRIAMAWAWFETHVNNTIWELSNVESHLGACITSQITQPVPKFRALVALIHFRGGSEEAIAKFNSMSGSADGIARRRNRVVHDPAAADDAGNFHRLEITADRKVHFGMKPEEIENFKRLEDDIKDLTKRFYHLAQETIAALPPFDKTRFEQSPGITLSLPPSPSTAPTTPPPPHEA